MEQKQKKAVVFSVVGFAELLYTLQFPCYVDKTVL